MPNEILSLVTKIGVDGRGFRAGLKEVETDFNKFATGLKSQVAGAFGAAALTLFTKNAIAAASKLQDLSEQTGGSVDQMRRLTNAADNAGLSVESFASVLNKVEQARAKAAGGDDKLISLFGRLNVTLADTRNESESTVTQIERMGAALSTMEVSPTFRNELKEIFGTRAGTKFIEALKEFGTNKNSMVGPLEETVSILDQLERKTKNFLKFLQLIPQNIAAAAAFVMGVKPAQKPKDTRDPFLSTLSDDELEEYRKQILRQGGKDLHIDEETFSAVEAEQATRAQMREPAEQERLAKINAGIAKEQQEASDKENKYLFSRLSAGQQAKKLQTEINALLEGEQYFSGLGNAGMAAAIRSARFDKLMELSGITANPANSATFNVDPLGGFGSGGAMSHGFKNSFDPRMAVMEGQLEALTSIKSDVSAIKNNMTTGGGGDP